MSSIAWFKRMVSIFGNTVADGTVSAAKLAANAVETAKILNGAVTNAKVSATAGIAVTKLEGLAAGAVLVGVDGTGANNAKVVPSGDATMSAAGVVALNAAHEEQLVQVPVEALAAGVDIAARPVYAHPRASTLVSAGILTQGAPTCGGADTIVVALKDGAGNTIVTKTYNAGAPPPTSDYADLGALNGTYKSLDALELVTLSVTQSAGAIMPAFALIIRAVPTNA